MIGLEKFYSGTGVQKYLILLCFAVDCGADQNETKDYDKLLARLEAGKHGDWLCANPIRSIKDKDEVKNLARYCSCKHDQQRQWLLKRAEDRDLY